MKIEPIQPQQPSFGLNTQRTIQYRGFTQKSIIDTVYLQNGKSLKITKNFNHDRLKEKIYILKDQLGNWIKFKTKNYKIHKLGLED